MVCLKLHNNFKYNPPPSGELEGDYKYMFGGKEQQEGLGLNWYDITSAAQSL